jgi:MFS family permease
VAVTQATDTTWISNADVFMIENVGIVRQRLARLMPDLRGLPRPFWVLFAGTLVNRVGGFVLVFLAIYLTDARGLTPVQAGAILTAYGLGAIVGGPIAGALSDRIGRRPTLVASLMAGGASMLVLGLVTGHVTMIIGGLISARSYRALFAADAVTTALFGLIVWVALPETRPTASVDSGTSGSRARSILHDHAFLAVCLLTVAFCLVFFQSFAALPIDVRAHGISSSGFGVLMALNGVLVVLLQPLAGELIRDHARSSVLAVASLLLGIGFGMNAWIGSWPAYAASVVVWTLGEILFSPASTALVADLAPANLRGRYQGAFAMAFTSGFALAPIAGGYVLGHAGARWLWMACLAIGLAVGLGFLMLRRALRRVR